MEKQTIARQPSIFTSLIFISLGPSLTYIMVNSQDYSWLMECGLKGYIQISGLKPKIS